MPRAKSTSTSKRPAPRSKKSDHDSLVEFEDFIAQKPASRHSSRGWLLGTFLVIIIILAGTLFYVSKSSNLEKELKFKAVYLDTNQIYYAKVVKEDALNIYLDEVYYIQTEERQVPAEEEGGEDQLITVPV